jgi:ligand-binding sensor domain-containing protein/signal transduction histidine kinase
MIYKKPLYLLLFLLVSIKVSTVFSQSLNLNLTALNSIDGLSQHTIQCIFKDKYGFMWFGTQDGLNKYDGYSFTVYKHQYNNPSTLPANNVTVICEDTEGNIWVGTRTGGLSKFDYALNKFKNFASKALDTSSISDNNISNIYCDKSGSLWIGTANGLNRFDKKSNKFKRFLHTGKANSLSHSKINSIFEDSAHNLWIGTADGLNLLNKATGNAKRYVENTTSSQSTDNTINTITEDTHHQLWMGTNKGLKLLNRSTNTFTYFATEADKNSPKGINPIAAITADAGNRLWIGTYSTLLLFDTYKKQLIPLSDKANGENLIPNDGIYALLKDKDGILWIGTSSQGILMYDRNLSTFPLHKAALSNRPSAKNIIRAIDEDKKGNLYLATDDGLDYFNRTTYSYKSYYHQPNNTNSLASNYTTVVITSKKDGHVWIGTDNSGLDCLDPNTGKFTHYVEGSGARFLNDNTIYGLLEDTQGNIWIGTYVGGINVFDTKTKTFTKYVHDAKNPASLGDNSVQTILQDRTGNIWIGGYSNGISIFNKKTKTFSRLNSRNSNLNCDIISVLYEDKKGNMWVGTMEGGLNYYNRKTGRFTAYTEQNGLINNTVNFITEDADGNIWLSTNKGVTCFNPTQKSFKNYDHYNGLKSQEYNIGAGIKLSNGEIALGGINGFNFINPRQLNFNKNKPNVVITGFELFNKPVTVGAEGSPLQRSILNTKNITLTYSQSVFTITYAALSFTTPQHNQYAYQLLGFDDDWRHVGNQRKATYTNLDAGTYIFKVKAANNDGIWNTQEATIFITIKPPYWETWWFRTLAVLLVGVVAYQLLLYRKKQQSALKKLEENKFKERVDAVINAQEEERRRIAESLHNEFGQLLFAAKMKIPSDNLETAGILNEAISKVRSISYELMPPILEDYGLEYALQDMASKKLKPERIKYQANITGLKTRISPVLEIAVYRIVQELLNNIVKHAKADFVEMKISKKAEALHICLTDNGMGLPKTDGTLVKKKNEFGLNYITSRVHLLRGTINIGPGKQSGTQIEIELPLNEVE